MIDAKTIQTYIDSSRQEAVELLKELGKIPAPSHKEDKRATFCLNWFKEQGVTTAYIDAAKNVVCEIGCDAHEDVVVFTAHTDIVFDDMQDLPLRVEGNTIFAPGIGDDTANLVNLLIATKYFLKNKKLFTTGIIVVANSCEEGLGNLDGSKEIIKTYGSRMKAFYSFDGYLSQCTSIPVGSHRFRVTVRAQGGHSYLDFGRENAIYSISNIIRDLFAVEIPKQAKTTFNVGRIEGGTTVNSIPQEVSMLYEYRSPSEQCLASMKASFDAIIEKHTSEGRQVEVELLGVRPGMGDLDPSALEKWTASNIETIKQFYDGAIDIDPYSTDANVPLSKGILANTIGTVVGGGAHTRQEWVDLESLPVGTSIIMSLIGQYVV